MRLKCKFGEPKYGWLPVHIQVDDFELEMVASDVPVSPIALLQHAVWCVHEGREYEVWWHLEPESYYFEFTPMPDGMLEFVVSFARFDTTKRNRERLVRKVASKQAITIPFWRSIKELASRSFKNTDWPSIDHDDLDKLATLIKS